MNYISRKEHNFLLAVAFLSIIFVAITFSWQLIKDYNYSVQHEQTRILYQANYGRPSGFPYGEGLYVLPGFHFLTLFIFIALYKAKRFFVSLILTILYISFAFYGLLLRYESSILASPNIHISLMKKMYAVSNLYDYMSLSLASVLLFWQISILLRMLIKNTQRKNVLP